MQKPLTPPTSIYISTGKNKALKLFNAIKCNEEIFKSFIERSWDKIMDFVIVVFIYSILSPTILTLTQTTTSMQKGTCE